MSAATAGWAGRVTRRWVRVYTTGLPRQVARERRDEIASDLWEHAADAGAAGAESRATAAQILGRTVCGVGADFAWLLDELKGSPMQHDTHDNLRLAAAAVVGLLSITLGIVFLAGGLEGPWSVDDAFFEFTLLAVITGIVGPFVAVLGLYALRRAQAEGESLTRPRLLLIGGTGGVALLGGAAFWTILGPLVAIGIVGYWIVKIAEWRGERPLAP